MPAEGARPTGRVSAGILLFRVGLHGLEVLLAHPGGPWFAAKDAGHWSIPKGEAEPGEELATVAAREFEEETGCRLPGGRRIELGSIRQKGGKLVVAWAVEGDLDVALAASNTFTLEWPPRSGRFVEVPEIDRLEWFDPPEARRRIKEAQLPFLEGLEAALGRPGAAPTDARTKTSPA